MSLNCLEPANNVITEDQQQGYQAARTKVAINGKIKSVIPDHGSNMWQLGIVESQRLKQYRSLAASWGWRWSWKSNNTVLAEKVPKVCETKLGLEHLLEFMEQLRCVPETDHLANPQSCFIAAPPAVRRLLESKACHTAVRFGDFLSEGERETLIGELANCIKPFQCAHGRPSVAILPPTVHGTAIIEQFSAPW
jgi:DNA mismatch repair ATPase MutL